MSNSGQHEPDTGGHGEPPFRWQAVFQRCAEPLFLLNWRREVLFVNRAWEALTGQPLGRVRRRHPRPRKWKPSDPDALKAVLTMLAPPPEAMRGQQARVRRAFPRGPGAAELWDISFFPLRGRQRLLGILGKIAVVAREAGPANAPVPFKLLGLRERAAGAYGVEHLQSEVPAQNRVLEQVRLASGLALPVLLVGEPGTGKHWVARTIHHLGDRREHAFARVDCARLPAAAVGDVLFGPAGLLWRDDVGSVYLREPGRLPRELQARLCAWLVERAQETGGQPRARVLAGMSGDPDEQVRAGLLLEELGCLLSTLTIALPPLRQRLPDLATLCECILGRLAADPKRPVRKLAPEALERLHAHPWPGNLRELHTALALAAEAARGERIEADDLPWYLRSPAPPPRKSLPLDELLEQAERRLLLLALRLAGQNRTKAAEMLCIPRLRLLRRLEKLELVEKQPPQEAEPEG